ncbi:MAG: EI24 domain-containing protein [Bacteroidota bacterium]|jgi:CysZ protein
MKFFTQFFKGFGYCFKSLSIIFDKGLWPFLFIPLIVCIVLIILSFYGIYSFSSYIADYLKPYLEVDAATITNPGLIDSIRIFLSAKAGFIINLIIKILLGLVSGTFVKYTLLIVLSPFLALLSEKADEKLHNTHFKFSVKQLLIDITRGVLMSLRNMFLEYFFIFIFMLVSVFIAPLSVVTIPLLFLISCYFVGFNFFDYNSERYKLRLKESSKLASQNRGYLVGIGCFYFLVMHIPTFVGTVLGIAFGPAMATVAAVLCFKEIELAQSNTNSVKV